MSFFKSYLVTTSHLDKKSFINFLIKNNSSKGADLLAVETVTLYPEEDKLTISINQVRDLKETLAFGTGDHKLRLVIIQPADVLTLQAQNALLKILEEPPANTVLVLATLNPSQILPTIHSRCVFINLNENNHKEKKDSELVLKFNSYTEAINQAKHYKDKTQAIEILKLVAQNSKLKAKKRELILETVKQLEGNFNLKLALEALFFQFVSPK